MDAKKKPEIKGRRDSAIPSPIVSFLFKFRTEEN